MDINKLSRNCIGTIFLLLVLSAALASEKEFEQIRNDVWYALLDHSEDSNIKSRQGREPLFTTLFLGVPNEFKREFYDELGEQNNGGEFSELFHQQLDDETVLQLLEILLGSNSNVVASEQTSAHGPVVAPDVNPLESYYQSENNAYGSWAIPAANSKLDWIYYHYGTACYGLDWRVLKAFSIAESSERTNLENRAGYQGLGQWKARDCRAPNYISEFKDGSGSTFLSCNDMLDPEANVAATAGRLHRFFKGERLQSQTVNHNGASLAVHKLEADSTWRFPLLTRCPNTSIEDMSAMSYIGHNNGPRVLLSVLRQGACDSGGVAEAEEAMRNTNPTQSEKNDYQLADVQWKAVWSWYDDKSPASSTDIAATNVRLSNRGLPNYLHLTASDGQFRGVGGRYGIYKWRYGHNRIAPQIIAQNIAELYPHGARNPIFCPAVTQERVYPRTDFPLVACKPWKPRGQRGQCS